MDDVLGLFVARWFELDFLQEPTSGLDSSTAYALTLSLKKYAVQKRKTVMMTIHQPSVQVSGCELSYFYDSSNSSDGLAVRASASWSYRVDSVLISSRVKPMILTLVFTATLLDVHYKSDSVENRSVSLLVVPLGKALRGIPHLRVVDRWPATPKRARYGALIAFS